MRRSTLASLVLTCVFSTTTRTASSQDTSSTDLDTVCFSINEVRTLLEGFTLGNEGFERLEVELRLHAHTYARLSGCRKSEAVMKDALVTAKRIMAERLEQRDLLQAALDHEKEKSRRRGFWNWLLGGVAAGLAAVTLAQ